MKVQGTLDGLPRLMLTIRLYWFIVFLFYCFLVLLFCFRIVLLFYRYVVLLLREKKVVFSPCASNLRGIGVCLPPMLSIARCSLNEPPRGTSLFYFILFIYCFTVRLLHCFVVLSFDYFIVFFYCFFMFLFYCFTIFLGRCISCTDEMTWCVLHDAGPLPVLSSSHEGLGFGIGVWV